MEESTSANRSRLLSIVASVLFLLTLVALIFFINRNSKLQQENANYISEVDALTQEKYELLTDLDSLRGAYEDLSFVRDSLDQSLGQADSTIEVLNRIRRQNASSLSSLRQEVNQLRGLRNQMEATVAELEAENEALIARNDSLTQELQVSTQRNRQLATQTANLEEANEALLEETNRLKAASVRASGFTVDVQQRNGRPTTSGRRADKIIVNFDMTGVPPNYQGLHTLYLIISDATGVPIESRNPVRTRINVNGEIAEFEAQLAKEVSLADSQRLTFNHEVQERRLDPGYYRVAIYSDMGFLGSAGFQLR